jgi:uncharacterized protein (DUF924 family)
MRRRIATLDEVLDFWFGDGMPSRWFDADAALDEQIRERFEPTWQSAVERELDWWTKSAPGALALAIVLDQFPLNMYRGQARAFASEAQAIDVTLAAIAQGQDLELEKQRLAFLYMPLMHSEKLQHQDLAVQLFDGAELEANARFARHHRDLIKRFGRFPHRNAILGRSSDRGERAYLASKEAFTG